MSDSRLTRLGLRPSNYGNSWGLAVSASETSDPVGVVIALHGGLDRSASFARVARRLPGWSFYAPDRRGYGGSRDLGPGTLAQDVDDVRRLIDELAPTHPVVLFGHSFGGLIALASVARGISVNQVIAYEPPLPWFTSIPGTVRSLSDDPATEAELFFRRMIGDAIWERLAPDARDERLFDGPALQADLRELHAPLSFDVAAITVPVTMAYGDGPHRAYYADCASGLRSAGLALSEVALEKASHGAHLAQPDVVARLITSTVES